MPKVTFALGFKSSELNALDFPVEVRRPNSSLVARTSVSTGADLAPGKYYATSSLPGGQQLLSAFTVESDPLSLTLAPSSDDASPHEWEELAHFLVRPAAPRTATTAPAPVTTLQSAPTARDLPSGAEADSPSGHADTSVSAGAAPEVKREAQLLVWAGNPLNGPMQQQAASALLSRVDVDPGRAAQFRILSGQSERVVIQLRQTGSRAQNIPIMKGMDTLTVTRTEAGECRMEPHLPNRTAEMLLRYCGANAPADAGQVLKSVPAFAQLLIAQKVSDPVSAAIAAYAILRFGELTQLGDWTGNLLTLAPSMPDALAIRGEHLARIGRHGEASSLFCRLPAVGLPSVADGLFYVTRRLRSYLPTSYASDKTKDWSRSLQSRVDITLVNATFEILQPFAVATDIDRPVTTYAGADPAKPPSDSLSSALTTAPMALELERLLAF